MAESLPRFVHLRLHSEFSVVDGLVRISDAVEVAVADLAGLSRALWDAAS